MICSRAAGGSSSVASQAARLGTEQPGARRDAVVKKRRLDALLPLAALVDERVAQPDAGAQLEQMLGRDP